MYNETQAALDYLVDYWSLIQNIIEVEVNENIEVSYIFEYYRRSFNIKQEYIYKVDAMYK